MQFSHATARSARRSRYRRWTARKKLTGLIGERGRATAEDVELLEIGEDFEFERFLRGDLAPVFFGSALTNFGVEVFLDAGRSCAAAAARASADGASSSRPARTSPASSSRSRRPAWTAPSDTAFLRVCSGRFERGRPRPPPSFGRTSMSAAPTLCPGQETVRSAYPGDVIQAGESGIFAIGDTVHTRNLVEYRAISPVPAGRFARLVSNDVSRTQRCSRTGPARRGVIRSSTPSTAARAVVLGAVGDLQFDVIIARLENGTASTGSSVCLTGLLSWVDGTSGNLEGEVARFAGLRVADRDDRGDPALRLRRAPTIARRTPRSPARSAVNRPFPSQDDRGYVVS
ncbi:MAG: hypothetical protein R2849_20985 [Thermomicrobiales bacterium]